MAQLGNNIIVYAQIGNSWAAVASVKSNELDGECDMLETATSETQDYKTYKPGRKAWSLNVSWLVSAVADIRKVLELGTRVKIRVGGRTWSASTGVEGYAYVRQCRVTATIGSLAQGSFSFQGDGPLE